MAWSVWRKAVQGLIFFTFPVLLVPKAQADDAEKCLDRGRVENYIKRFHITVLQDENGKPAIPPYDLCDSSQMFYTFAQAMMLIEDLPALDVHGDAYDRGLMKQKPFDYFKARVSKIYFDTKDMDPCSDGNTAAYVRFGEGHVMHICPQSSSSDLLYMASTLLHEARHVEGYDHELCNHGRWAGTGFYGCDRSYQEGGAYAIETEWNIRMSRTPAIAPVERAESRMLAVQAFLENFNKAPYGLRAGLMVQGQDSSVKFFDGKGAVTIIPSMPPAGTMTVRSAMPTIYDPQDDEVTSYLSPQVKIPTDGLYAQNFRNKLSPTERMDLKDVTYLGKSSCVLSVHKIRCDLDAKNSEISLPNMNADHLINLNGHLAVVDHDGYGYRIPMDKLGTPAFTESAFRRLPNRLDLMSLVKWKGVLVGVDLSGDVRKYNSQFKPGAPVADIANLHPRKIIGPVFWSEQLAAF